MLDLLVMYVTNIGNCQVITSKQKIPYQFVIRDFHMNT